MSAAGKTVSLYKKRQRINPREVHGLFQRWRWFFVFLTRAVFYGLPWLQWTTELGQRQAVLFDLEANSGHELPPAARRYSCRSASARRYSIEHAGRR